MKTNWEKEFDKKFNCDSPNGKELTLKTKELVVR
jgi:hypothetical protein